MGGQTHQSVEASLYCIPLVFEPSELIALSLQQLQLRLFCPGTGLQGDFCSGKLWFSVPCLSLQFWGTSVCPMTLSFLRDLRRVIGFSVCSVFYLLLGWTGDIQPPYVLDWKPEGNWDFWPTLALFPLHCTCLICGEFCRENTDCHILYYHSPSVG